MTLLSIDRSTDAQSVALAANGTIERTTIDSRRADWAALVRDFVASRGCGMNDLDKIVVGLGPGSFAGIRGALAFAQGLAIGMKATRPALADSPVVYGLPSAIAMADAAGETAVVGDARRGLFWVAVYSGDSTASPLRLVQEHELADAVPATASVVTPDFGRIGPRLRETFGERFAGGRAPDAGRMARIALDHPESLVPEPLPVYLSPAVRT